MDGPAPNSASREAAALPEAAEGGTTARSARETTAYRIPIRGGSTLPPVCAHCGELGNVPITIRSWFDEESDRVVFFRCGGCHARREREETRALAIVLASATSSVALGIALTLSLGFSGIWLILSSVALSAYLGPSAFERYFTAPDPKLEKTRNGLFLLLPHRTLATKLAEFPEPLAKLVPRSRGAIAGGLAVVVWSLLLYLGRTELFVFHHEPGSLLLVNDRVSGFPLPSLVESPSAGLRISLFAGPVDLALVNRDGRELLRTHALLEPGHSYLFGESPPGQCFTLVRGKETSRLGPSELNELPEPPAAWLEPAKSGDESARTGLSVRLTKCASGTKKTNE